MPKYGSRSERRRAAREAAAAERSGLLKQTPEKGTTAVNDGSVDEVLARVGDDPSKAAEALVAEGIDGRKTLIAALEAIVEGTENG